MIALVRTLLRRAKTTDPPAVVPDGLRLYVMGDIHGRADLLQSLSRSIECDADVLPAKVRKLVIYLGDYIDRGYESREAIDFLIGTPLPGFERVFLKGNHEDALLKFLEDPAAGPDWFSFGGTATLLSYGVPLPAGSLSVENLVEIQRCLKAVLPRSHFEFFCNLSPSYEVGGYFFAHAGIRPGRPLAEQWPEDLLWIRDEFLNSAVRHGKVIVHGHSPTDEPEVRPNRIGIDTGAYFSNRLTCLVLEGAERRFLATS